MTTLTIHEFNQLKTELFGYTDRESGSILFTGLLGQELPFKTKYWINSHLVSKFKTIEELIKSSVMSIREELGYKEGENIEKEEDLKLFQEKYIKFSEETVDIEFSIKLSYLESVNTNETYPIFMKFVIED